MSQQECRGRFHLKPQSPKHKKYCENCRSYISAELNGSTACSCCGIRYKPHPKHALIRNILNKALCHCEHIVQAYAEMPPVSHDVQCFIRVYYKGFTYMVPLQQVCRYREAYNTMHAGGNADFWSAEMLQDCALSSVADAAKRRMTLLGIGR